MSAAQGTLPSGAAVRAAPRVPSTDGPWPSMTLTPSPMSRAGATASVLVSTPALVPLYTRRAQSDPLDCVLFHEMCAFLCTPLDLASRAGKLCAFCVLSNPILGESGRSETAPVSATRKKGMLTNTLVLLVKTRYKGWCRRRESNPHALASAGF